MTYDPNNIFARILAGKAPCHSVYEDEHVLAIMDIVPVANGHTLVLPKAQAVDFLALPGAADAGVFAATRRVAHAVKEAFAADGVLVQIRNGAAAGQIIFHMHIHVIPCHTGRRLRPPGGEIAADSVLAGHAALIRAALERQADGQERGGGGE